MKTLIGLLGFGVLAVSVQAETVLEYQERLHQKRDALIRQIVEMEKIHCKELTDVEYPRSDTWTFRCDGKNYLLLRTNHDFVVLENP